MPRKIYIFMIVLGVAIGSILFVGGQSEILRMLFESDPAAPQGEFPLPGKTMYQMKLKLDARSDTLSGNSIISTINTGTKPLEEVNLILYPQIMASQDSSPAPFEAYYGGFMPSGIKIKSLSINGVAYEPVIDGINALIKLKEPIGVNANLSIICDWEEPVPLVKYRLGRYYSQWFFSDFYPILTDKKFVQPPFAARLYGNPFCFNSADYEVSVIYPDNVNIVANAVLAGRQASQDGQELAVYEANSIRDFCFFLVYDYTEIEKEQNGYKIKCSFPASKNANAPLTLSESCDIMTFYEDAFGKYPYQELTLLAGPLKGLHGMEYSSLILLQSDFTESGYERDRKIFILAQELAHQWWYGIVGNDQLQEPWLDEGLSIWCAYKYMSDNLHSKASYRDPLPAESNYGAYWQKLCAGEDFNLDGYSGPEAFWFALEKEIGQDMVMKVLVKYAAQYRQKHATSHDLLQIVNRETGDDYTAFFANWFPDQFGKPEVQQKPGE